MSRSVRAVTLERAGLSAREYEVLSRMSEGLTNEAIAADLHLSVKSIESVIRSLFAKLDLFDEPTTNRRVLAVRVFLDNVAFDAGATPSWSTEFVGRSREALEVAEAVSSRRLVTVVGPGGIGKSRLISEIVGPLRDTGATVHFVDVVGIGGLNVLGLLLRGFGSVLTSEAAGWRQLDRALRATPRVIVLDNAEQQLDDVRELATKLIAIGQTRVIVGSREPLGLVGEHLIWLLPLEEPDALRLLERRLAEAGIQQQPSGGGPWEQLLRAMSGIPLAIELTAVRLATLQVEDVVERLDRLPELLARPGVDRHARLQTVLDESYRALDPKAQAAFRRLSTFVGGFSLDGARRLLGDAGGDGRILIDQLVRASVVMARHGRYRMLEPVRQHALGLRDVCGERDECEQHLVQWCLALVEGAPLGYVTSSSWWNSQLGPEQANIDAAIVAAPSRIRITICSRLLVYWGFERPAATLAVVEDVLATVDESVSDVDRAWATLCVGHLQTVTGNHGGMDLLLEAAIAFRACDEIDGLAFARAVVADATGRAEDFDEAISLATEAGTPWIRGWAMLSKALMVTYRWLSDDSWPEPEDRVEVDSLIDEAAALARQVGFEMLRFDCLMLTARLRIVDGVRGGWLRRDSTLEAILTEAEQLARASGRPIQIADVLSQRNVVRLRNGAVDAARASLAELLKIIDVIDDAVVLSKAVLLAAAWLKSVDRDSEAYMLAAAAASSYCARIDPKWMALVIPSPSLLDHALHHTAGPINDVAAAQSLVTQARGFICETHSELN